MTRCRDVLAGDKRRGKARLTGPNNNKSVAGRQQGPLHHPCHCCSCRKQFQSLLRDSPPDLNIFNITVVKCTRHHSRIWSDTARFFPFCLVSFLYLLFPTRLCDTPSRYPSACPSSSAETKKSRWTISIST